MVSDESVAERLARIEVKLDQALTQHGDHEDRIRVLEKKVWWASGIAVAAGTGLSQVLQALGKA